MAQEAFNLKLAKECASAFSGATGLGCVVSDRGGTSLAEYGYGCVSCRMCALLGQPHSQCVHAQNYSMAEAERFGGARNGAVFDGGDVVAQNSNVHDGGPSFFVSFSL